MRLGQPQALLAVGVLPAAGLVLLRHGRLEHVVLGIVLIAAVVRFSLPTGTFSRVPLSLVVAASAVVLWIGRMLMNDKRLWLKPAPTLPDTPCCRIVLGDVCRCYEESPDEARFINFDTALSWQTSYKRETIARLRGYDETFRCYGWEDIEFSYRATQAGLRFYYEPRAISFHNDQRQTLAAHVERLRNASRMAPSLFARHPELAAQIPMYFDKVPIAWGEDGGTLITKKLIRRIFAARLVVAVMEGLTPLVERVAPWPGLLRRWYYGILGSYVLKGYREGLLTANGQEGS